MDLRSKVSREQMENARLNRDSALHPPDADPGMEDGMGDLGLGDSFTQAGAGGGSPGGAWGDDMLGGADSLSQMPNIFAQGSAAPFNPGGPQSPIPWNSVGANQPGQQQAQAPEDKFFDAMAKGAKGTVSFTKSFVIAVKSMNAKHWSTAGSAAMITGGVLSVIGIVMMLLKVYWGINLIGGGVVGAFFGFLIYFTQYDKNLLLKQQEYEEKQAAEAQQFAPVEDESDFFPQDEVGLDSDGYDMGEDDDEDDLLYDEFDSEPEAPLEPAMDPDEALDSIEYAGGMMTRQFLYESFSRVLPQKTPKFSEVHNYDEDDDDFQAWCGILDQCTQVLAPESAYEDMPQLLGVRDKLFYTQLEVSRTKWLKSPDKLVNEIVNLCAYDQDTCKMDPNIYGTGTMVGGSMFIKILKGETAIVTIKDAYGAAKDKVLDTDNYMPVILGIDSEGMVVCEDLKKIYSLMITGAPRSGKSWLAKSIVAQMAAYLSPSELQFYFFDVKGSTSDLRTMALPHVKKFESSKERILAELGRLVNEEGPRRKKMMEDIGQETKGDAYIDFLDLKKERPDIDFPILYVVIDEVISLTESMTKEEKQKFNELLLVFVSQFPNLGIRLFMIPHVVKNQVISKNVTDMIPCRICVKGTASDIENVLGVTKTAFDFRLNHTGDMAARIGSGAPQFIHGAILTDNNNESTRIFDFLSRFWMKMQPGCEKGSFYERKQLEKQGKLPSSKPASRVTFEPVQKGLSQDEVAELLKTIDQDDGDDEVEDLWSNL